MAKALALIVNKSRGQAAVTMSRRMGLTDSSLRVLAIEGELCIPLAREASDAETKELTSRIGPIRIQECKFTERVPRHRTLTEALHSRLPSDTLANVPRSMDLVGDVAIVELPKELALHEQAIGEAILETCPNVHTVMAKAGAFSSDYRIRDLKLIAGEDKSVTCHKEHGCLFEIDIKSAFFSPRLSHERSRVASQVKPNEVVLDMFAGVGPYSILIARKQLTATVHAVDANPSAFKFLVSNILLNKVYSNTKAVLGDVRETVESNMLGIADRAIMNLPGKAETFVDVACVGLRKRGGIVHFYSFEETEHSQDSALAKLNDRVEASGRSIRRILTTRIVKEIAPYRVQVVVDAQLA